MNRRVRVLGLLALTGVLAVSGCGDDDGADPADDGPVVVPTDPSGPAASPDADLTFAVRLDGLDGEPTSYRLVCEGDTAVVTGDPVALDPPSACLALATTEVRTRLLDGPAADRICIQVHGGPEVASIIGTLDGLSVDTTVDRANGCGVADYDLVLGSLLPPATQA